MTSPSPQPTPSPPDASPVAPVVNPEPNSRLEQLAAEYALLKPQVDRMEEVKTAIKAELAKHLTPGQTSVLLTCWALDQPLRMHHVAEGWRIDAKAMRASDPHTFARWATRRKGYWELRAVS